MFKQSLMLWLAMFGLHGIAAGDFAAGTVQEATKAHANLVAAQRLLADALEAAGRHDAAADAYSKLAEVYSADGAALTKEGHALKAAGRQADADAIFASARAKYSEAADLAEKAASILLEQLDASQPPAPPRTPPDAPPLYRAPPPTDTAPPRVTFEPKVITPAATARPAAASPAAARADADAPAVFKVGDKIQYLLGKTWFDVAVVKADGAKFIVHHEGRTKSKYETWDRPATLDELRAVPVLVAAPAQAGEKGLDGLYVQIMTLTVNGRPSLQINHTWFRPDGNVYFALPPGGLSDPGAFAALLKQDPKNCGTYGIAGGKITFQRAGGKPEVYDFGNEGKGAVVSWSGPPSHRVGAFVENANLSGNYSGGASAFGGGGNVSVAAGLNLHADGTYESSRVASIDSTGERVSVGAGAEGSSRGKYQLSGNTLTLTDSAGTSIRLTVYPEPEKDESPPNHLCVDGTMYKLTPGK